MNPRTPASSGPSRSPRSSKADAARRTAVELLERRQLLSASYLLTTLAQLEPFANPTSGLVADPAGDLYGTTYGGGAYGRGSVFEITAGSGIITTVVSFDGANGDRPVSGLTLDSGGNLYGTTSLGGSNGDGTLFEIAAGSNALTTLTSFDGVDAGFPLGALMLDAEGDLWGTGPTRVFEFLPGSDILSIPARFTGSNGYFAASGLTQDTAGNLYGTTEAGGRYDGGTVFELDPQSGTLTTLVSFNGPDGSFPVGGVAIDAAGNLYGTTEFGGSPGDQARDEVGNPGGGRGTVFEIANGSGTITTLFSFESSTGLDGAHPLAGVTLDSAGNLYGTTSDQGTASGGTVFEIDKESGTLTTLAAFGNGATPAAGVILDAEGDLFGTTEFGGGGGGSVFELIPSTQSAAIQSTLQNIANSLQHAATGGPTPPIQVQVSDQATLDNLLSAVSGIQVSADGPAVDITVDASNATYQDTQVSVPPNVTLTLNGATFVGGSPALVVASGTVVITNSTLINATDAPTILVKGGNLILSGDTIQQSSTVYVQPAIEVDGGTVDLGSAAAPGGNTLETYGGGMLIDNATANRDAVPIDPAAGNIFEMNGTPITTGSGVEGEVWVDFNNDGNVDFGEQGISGVTITLTGTDTLGRPVQTTCPTGTDGIYTLANLWPGVYTITETGGAALGGYTAGIDSVGTLGAATVSPGVFSNVTVGPAQTGFYYNFGQQPAPGSAVAKGQAAGIGFWANKNGQALIARFTGTDASNDTQFNGLPKLSSWLAETMPNLFGGLIGMTPPQVAQVFLQKFVLSDKLDAQVMATALNAYATNQSLAGTAAAYYGFTGGQYGLGDATWKIGSDGAAFGVANNTTLTVMQILQDWDNQTNKSSTSLRKMALDAFGGINSKGGI